MDDLLIYLIKEYQRLLEIEGKYHEWKKEYPEKFYLDYEGERVSHARMKRLGVMIREKMIEYEKTR